jgi:hypothetical protein
MSSGLWHPSNPTLGGGAAQAFPRVSIRALRVGIGRDYFRFPKPGAPP